MDPATVIALLTAAYKLEQELQPLVAQMISKGQITPEQQADLIAARKAIGFDGPEWLVEPATPQAGNP